jgi:predicted transcriptional regulator
MHGPQSQIALTLKISPRVYDTLKTQGAERGYQPTPFAQLLFEAAFAARCAQARGEQIGDRELDDMLRIVFLLAGQADTTAIARWLSVSEAFVVRMLEGWRIAVRAPATRPPAKAETRPAGGNPAAPDSQRRILAAIASECGGELRPVSYRLLEDRCGVSAPTVSDAIRRLAKIGWLEVEKIGQRNHFRITDEGRKHLE